jgi:anti-sigma regulatory factor (Ser/Thr protein kinase)
VTRVYPIDDPSRVAQVRRAAAVIAHEEGLDEALAARAAIVVTEICTNLLKHAQNGEVFLSTLSDRSGPGIEILAIDRGPGMTDIARCLEDGYSSGKTPGTGFGAIVRQSQQFDIHSEQKRGTVLVARVQAPEAAAIKVGAVLKPMAGEEVSGDAWRCRERKGEIALIVADGLGHGILAARASAEAISAFSRSRDSSPTAVLQQVHGALRSTRGAAVAVAYLDCAAGMVQYAGIGNIAGVLAGAGKPVMMISHNGTAGYHAPRFQEFSYAFPQNGLIIMHSDGLHTGWNLDEYPGLRRRDPSIVAGVLYREATRNRDDACVVVVRPGGAS